MNIPLVLMALGGILVIEGVMLLICFLYSLLFEGGIRSEWPQLWLSCFIPTIGAGFLLTLLGKGADRSRVFRREAFAVVSLGWLICGAFASLPFLLSPLTFAPWDALFEAYSGLTTTGATIVTDLTLLPRSLILWRSILEWMGGLGIIILFVAVLGFFGIGNRALFSRESSALADSDMATRFQSLSFRYLLIYVAFTIISAGGLLLCGLDLFSAVNHAMCAIATGGFSPHNESIAFYPDISVHLWITLSMFVGGVAFPLHYAVLIKKRLGVLKENEEFRFYAFIILFVSSVIALDLTFNWHEESVSKFRCMVDSLFQTVAIMTTSGFVSADYDQWPPLSKFLLLGLMIMGGCAGSTSGGMKVSRFLVFGKTALRHLHLVYRPHLVKRLKLNGKVLPEEDINGVIIYFAIYFVLILIGILGLAFLEPNLRLTSTFSAIISSINNIGPALADVGPTKNYAALSPFSKLWLSAFMLIGRLEIYAILLLLLPSFWKRF
ncbi:MAG: TrkH family potassium uptake protein [Verrucomicrobiota bacterium]